MERPKCECTTDEKWAFETRVREVVAITTDIFLAECNENAICHEASGYTLALTVAHMIRAIVLNTHKGNEAAGFIEMAASVSRTLGEANAQLAVWEAEVEASGSTKQ